MRSVKGRMIRYVTHFRVILGSFGLIHAVQRDLRGQGKKLLGEPPGSGTHGCRIASNEAKADSRFV